MDAAEKRLSPFTSKMRGMAADLIRNEGFAPQSRRRVATSAWDTASLITCPLS